MDIVRLEYGYDRSGNRLYRRDEVARSQTPLAKYDELYGYDGLNRLTSFDRGELNVGNTGLTGSPTPDPRLDARRHGQLVGVQPDGAKPP